MPSMTPTSILRRGRWTGRAAETSSPSREAIYRSFAPGVTTLARRLLGRPAAAEDGRTGRLRRRAHQARGSTTAAARSPAGCASITVYEVPHAAALALVPRNAADLRRWGRGRVQPVPNPLRRRPVRSASTWSVRSTGSATPRGSSVCGCTTSRATRTPKSARCWGARRACPSRSSHGRTSVSASYSRLPERCIHACPYRPSAEPSRRRASGKNVRSHVESCAECALARAGLETVRRRLLALPAVGVPDGRLGARAKAARGGPRDGKAAAPEWRRRNGGHSSDAAPPVHLGRWMRESPRRGASRNNWQPRSASFLSHARHAGVQGDHGPAGVARGSPRGDSARGMLPFWAGQGRRAAPPATRPSVRP